MIARLRQVRRSADVSSAYTRNALLVAAILTSSSAMAAEPLRELINRELDPPSGVAWPIANDAEFLRRVSLDLNGMPPSANEARAFLTDNDPAKREKLIDRLFTSPLFARHMATTLDVMLMERRTNTNVSQDEWQAWLLKSVQDNKPWNVLVREILTSDGEDPAARAAARFCLDRGTEPNAIARDVGRIFFGRDMQCAQCHDSPLVTDFLQHDYQGLLAFASTSAAVKKKIGEKDITILAERSGNDLTFESVFIKGTMHRTGARVLGEPLLAEPFFLPGDEYSVAPAEGVRSVPKFSRRAMLAEQATSGANRAFNENIANRLWAMMLGRGIVHPLDMIHPDNPAASPVLLRQLGERFAAMHFDMKSFLREIALSDVYQRPFDLSDDVVQTLQAATVSVPTLQDRRAAAAETAKAALVAWETVYAAFQAAEAAMIPVALEFDAVRNQYAEAKKKVDDAQKAVNDAAAALASKKAFHEALTQAVAPLQNASAALPADQALAATVQQLSARTTAVAAELPPLEQSLAEKTTALAAPTETMIPARTAVDAAQQKLQPLLDTVRTTDAATVTARKSMADTASELTALDDQIRMLGRLSVVSDRRRVVEETRQTAAICETELSAAGQRVTDYLPVSAERTAQLQGAETTMNNATNDVSAAQEKVSRTRTSLTVLTDARDALAKAQAVLADDKSLADSAKTLQDRTATLSAELQTAEQNLMTAGTTEVASSSALVAMKSAMEEADSELRSRRQTVAASEATVTTVRETLAAQCLELEQSLSTAPSDLSSRFALSQLKPLTPEQMCWTVFKVTTVYDRCLAIEVAEFDKTAPLTVEQKTDPAILSARAAEVELRTYDKLKSNIVSYVQIYGGGPGQPQGDFYASADQALFTANGGSINSWVVPAGDNAAERIVNSTDPRVAAEELYLGILTRMPMEEEVTEVASILAARPDRSKAAQELVWGLISSAEFRFNR